MRISDWSSDVCSSDLAWPRTGRSCGDPFAPLLRPVRGQAGFCRDRGAHRAARDRQLPREPVISALTEPANWNSRDDSNLDTPPLSQTHQDTLAHAHWFFGAAALHVFSGGQPALTH